MADSELHPVVQLILARMKSHPEEFESGGYGRWQYALDQIGMWASDEEKDAIDAEMRDIQLEALHVWALDELCNGEERRAEEEKRKAARAQAQAYAQSVQQLAQNTYLQGQQTAGWPTNTATLGNILNNAYLNSNTPSVQLGHETIDENFIAKTRRKLGI